MRFKLDKTTLVAGLSVLLVAPWLSGGRDNIALLLDFFMVTAALFLIWRLPVDDRPQLGGWLPIVLVALFVWGALSLGWSVNRFQTVSWLVQWFLVIGAFIIGRWLAHNKTWRDRWIRAYLAVATIFSVYGMYLLVTAEYNRLTSTFYWANPMAGFLLPALVIGAFWWSDHGNKLNGLMAVLVTASFLLTDSRGGLLALAIVGLVVLVTVRRKSLFWGRLALLIIASFLASVLVSGLRQWDHHGTSVPVASQSSRFQDAVSGESVSVTDRINYLKSSQSIISAHPLLGTGAGTFATVYPKYQLRVISATTNDHNYYVQTAVELGLIGGGLLLAAAILIVLGGLRGLAADKSPLPLVIGLAALLIHLGLDIDAGYPVILLLTGILAGIVYHHGSGQSWYLPLGLGLAILLVWPVISMYQSQAWRDRGVADQDNHSYDLAAADFNQAHSGLVYDPDVLTAEGINYDKLGTLRIDLTSNATKALSDARQAIKLDSSDSQHYFLQARAQVLAGHYDQAIQSYLAAISHDEWNHPVYYNDLIQVDIAYRQKWVDAARMVSTVIDLYPNDVISNRSADTTLEPTIAQSYALRADIWLHDNRPDQAKLDIGRALKLDKTNSLALQLQSQL